MSVEKVQLESAVSVNLDRFGSRVVGPDRGRPFRSFHARNCWLSYATFPGAPVSCTVTTNASGYPSPISARPLSTRRTVFLGHCDVIIRLFSDVKWPFLESDQNCCSWSVDRWLNFSSTIFACSLSPLVSELTSLVARLSTSSLAECRTPSDGYFSNSNNSGRTELVWAMNFG